MHAIVLKYNFPSISEYERESALERGKEFAALTHMYDDLGESVWDKTNKQKIVWSATTGLLRADSLFEVIFSSHQWGKTFSHWSEGQHNWQILFFLSF